MTLAVECYSGSQYAERPTALTWEGERLEITAIVKRWRRPEERCFRVRTAISVCLICFTMKP